MAKVLKIESLAPNKNMFEVYKRLIHLDAIDQVFKTNNQIDFYDGTHYVVTAEISLKGRDVKTPNIKVVKPYELLIQEIKELTNQK